LHSEKCQGYLNIADAIEELNEKWGNSKKLDLVRPKKARILKTISATQVNRNPLIFNIIFTIENIEEYCIRSAWSARKSS
jgi:hypothetical protein